ncbi:hypothetical protein M422DRAFT_23979 [Sphaerobolus stellatus SS14]|nr:hypothetical protein M422DRAFT_23979 [Sphaerobolus stellatus SS14]
MSGESQEQIVLVLVGLIGSGKSTFAQALQEHFPNFRRCNQDDLGSRRKVEVLATDCLAQGYSVCIDRTNFNQSQRQHWIDIARSFPNTTIWALIFDTPYEVCASRLETRTGHPTITSPKLGLSVLERFSSDYVPPTSNEDFDRIKTIPPHSTGKYTREEIQSILDSVRDSPALRTANSHRLQFFRGDGRSGGHNNHLRNRSASPPPYASRGLNYNRNSRIYERSNEVRGRPDGLGNPSHHYEERQSSGINASGDEYHIWEGSPPATQRS